MLSFKKKILTWKVFHMSSLTPLQLASTLGLVRITNNHLSNTLYGLHIDTDILTLYGTAANIIAYFTFNSFKHQFFQGVESIKKIPDQARECIENGIMTGKELNKSCTLLGNQVMSLLISDTIGKIAAKFLANTVPGRDLTWKQAFYLQRAELFSITLLASGTFALSYLRTHP